MFVNHTKRIALIISSSKTIRKKNERKYNRKNVPVLYISYPHQESSKADIRDPLWSGDAMVR